MEQFTASEVRDAITWKYGDKLTRISAMLTAFADLLEAREKAVPVAWMHPDLHDGHPYPEECLNQEKIEGWLPLYANSAQAQPPAAIVPTMRYFVGGPRACAYVDKFEHVEAVITALCKCTGDARDDYTSTDLLASERVR